jgi:adenylate cyclase
MPENTLAVLPFVNMSSNPEQEFLCDGMTEEIINALARIEGLKVTSRTSSFYFKSQSLPIQEIATQLAVAFILEGSIRIAQGQVRVTAQLIHATDDFHFWSESWDRKMSNLFALQDEISLLIADKLRENIGHLNFGEELVQHGTDNLDAYTLSLKAKQHFNNWSPVEVRRAIELYEEALKIDPKNVDAILGLADAHGFLATTQVEDRVDSWMKASDCTRKANEIAPDHPGVHYQLANLAFFTECDFQKAFEHFKRSIALRPSYPEAQQFVAYMYILERNLKAAERHLQLA